MNIFGDPYNRGCFVKMAVDSSRGVGARLVPAVGRDIPLSTPIGGTSTDMRNAAGKTDPFVVAGFSFHREETIAIMRCFNDKAFIYTFGDNIEQSMLGVKIIGFTPATSGGKSVEDMLNFYERNRISKTPKLANLTYGGQRAIMGYVLGIDSATVSAEYGMQSYDVRLLMVKK